MPSKTPYLRAGYYLWIARSGTVERAARFGSSEEKSYLKLAGEAYVPDGRGGFARKKLGCENTLSYDARANLMHMLAAANGGEMPEEGSQAAEWPSLIGVPLIVHVENRSYHPKVDGVEDEATTFWTTDIKGGATGWPAGVPLPAALEPAQSGGRPTAPAAPNAPREAVSAAPPPVAPQSPAPNAPEAQATAQAAPHTPRPSVTRPESAPTESPPARAPRVAQKTRPPASPAWHEKRKRSSELMVDALTKLGWSKGNDADPESNAAAVRAFWVYFDQVPAVHALKHVREDGSATFLFSEEGGATEDALDLLIEALSRSLQGIDVRPPAPFQPAKVGQP